MPRNPRINNLEIRTYHKVDSPHIVQARVAIVSGEYPQLVIVNGSAVRRPRHRLSGNNRFTLGAVQARKGEEREFLEGGAGGSIKITKYHKGKGAVVRYRESIFFSSNARFLNR